MDSFGYDPKFLGDLFFIPLPAFNKDLIESIYSEKDSDEVNFQNQYYTRYIHFSIATNKLKKQPAVVAVNIDQALLVEVPRREWNIDPQIGEYQLDESYFRDNVYDRGHLARRASVAWGETEDQALAASNSSMFYSNASLQHENFNQDEWLELENWVRELQEDSNDKITVFTGPIYGRRDGTSKVIGSPPAEIPSAFFKVVCFIDKKNKPATRAFLMAQDKRALTDKNGKNRNFDLGAYQVSVQLIEDETGLVFPDSVRESDPFKFQMNLISGMSVNDYPLVAPVLKGKISSSGFPILKFSESRGIGIISASIDSKADDSKNDWILIANLSDKKIELPGWTLSDTKHNPLKLVGSIPAGEIKRFDRLYNSRYDSGVVLSSKKGTVILFDKFGNIVDRVVYSCRNRSIKDGVPITFHMEDVFMKEEN